MKTRLEPSFYEGDRWKILHLDVVVNDDILAAVNQVDGIEQVWTATQYELRFKIGVCFDAMAVCTKVREALESNEPRIAPDAPRIASRAEEVNISG